MGVFGPFWGLGPHFGYFGVFFAKMMKFGENEPFMAVFSPTYRGGNNRVRFLRHGDVPRAKSVPRALYYIIRGLPKRTGGQGELPF